MTQNPEHRVPLRYVSLNKFYANTDRSIRKIICLQPRKFDSLWNRRFAMHRINCYREKQKNVQNCKQTLAAAAILIYAIKFRWRNSFDDLLPDAAYKTHFHCRLYVHVEINNRGLIKSCFDGQNFAVQTFALESVDKTTTPMMPHCLRSITLRCSRAGLNWKNIRNTHSQRIDEDW